MIKYIITESLQLSEKKLTPITEQLETAAKTADI